MGSSLTTALHLICLALSAIKITINKFNNLILRIYI